MKCTITNFQNRTRTVASWLTGLLNKTKQTLLTWTSHEATLNCALGGKLCSRFNRVCTGIWSFLNTNFPSNQSSSSASVCTKLKRLMSCLCSRRVPTVMLPFMCVLEGTLDLMQSSLRGKNPYAIDFFSVFSPHCLISVSVFSVYD